MQKFKVIQFLPYFPPHKGGVETVAEEWGKYFVKYGYGEVLNVIFSVGQETSDFEYTKNGCRVVIIPAFDLINNFPFPKFWTSGFWKALRAARDFNADIIQTHTRFFLSSLLGGAFAKWYKKKWVHVEHGSGYVVSDSALVRIFSKISDRTLGWWILKFSNTIVGISAACADFIQCEYGRTDTKVIYRGLECEIIPRPENPNNAIVRLAFAGRLVALK